MNHEHAHPGQPAQQPDRHSAPPFWRSRYAIGLVVLGVVAAYFLLTEHRAHVFGALPFLLLLACPLMHMFMHGGHSDGKQGVSSPEPGPGPGPAPKTGAQP